MPLRSFPNAIPLALVTYFLMSMGDIFTKKSTISYDLLYVAFFSNLGILATVLISSIFCGGPRNFIKTYCFKLHILRAVFLSCVYACFLYTISKMEVTFVYTLFLTQPFILAILAHFTLREHIGLHRILAIIGGFSGVVIALRPDVQTIDPIIFIAILGAFFFACQNIVAKFMDSRDHWMTYPFYVVAFQTPLMAMALLYINDFQLIDPPSLEGLFWMSGAGFFYALSLALLPICMRLMDASLFGALEYSILVWGAVLGYLAFSEIPDLWTIIGALIIVASGLYLVYREHKADFRIKE